VLGVVLLVFVLIKATQAPGRETVQIKMASLERGTHFTVFLTPGRTGRQPLGNNDYEEMLGFFRAGGSWSFRLVATARADAHAEWTVLILRSGSEVGAASPSFSLGSISSSGKASGQGGMKILDLYFADPAAIREFFRRFADGIDRGEFSALVGKTRPLASEETVTLEANPLTKSELLALIDRRE
jgi:hypothetical protein